jgi:hypothetical protein
MTRQMVRHLRWLKQNANKNVIKIEKVKIKHHAIGLIVPMACFNYWERVKSLFTLKVEEFPTEVFHKGRLMPLTTLKN